MEKIKNLLKRIQFRLKSFYCHIKRLIFKPKYPVNLDGKVYIHLGCGDINSPEYINIDSRPLPHVHHVSDVKSLPMFKDNFADLIYVSHTLEHVPMEDIREILSEWKRILKSGGCLRISVPDFDYIIDIYKSTNHSIDAIWRPLLGGQEYVENNHFAVFNKAYLTSLLKETGFREIIEWDPQKVEHHNFKDWASTELEIWGKLYPISLNLEAIK